MLVSFLYCMGMLLEWVLLEKFSILRQGNRVGYMGRFVVILQLEWICIFCSVLLSVDFRYVGFMLGRWFFEIFRMCSFLSLQRFEGRLMLYLVFWRMRIFRELVNRLMLLFRVFLVVFVLFRNLLWIIILCRGRLVNFLIGRGVFYMIQLVCRIWS